MAIISSRFHIPVPETDLLTYLFDSPLQNDPPIVPNEPLVLSTEEGDPPGYSIEQLKYLVKCFASGLTKRGCEGKTVLIYGNWTINFVVSLLGAIGAGAVCCVCPSNPPRETEICLGPLRPDFVLCAPEDIQKLHAVADKLEIPLKNVYSLDSSLEHHGCADHWASLLDTEDGPAFEWPRLSSEEAKTKTAMLIYTSGTTGPYKLAERTHYGLIGNAEQLLFRYNLKKRGKETYFCSFSPVGIAFLLYAIFIPLRARYRTIIMKRFDVPEYIRIVEQYKPTSLHAPKTYLQKLLQQTSGADFSSVTSIRTGGTIIPFKMCEDWTKLHGSPCEITCGMTEGGIQFASDPNVIETDGTIGELLPNLEAMVVDESGQALDRNVDGEIWIRNPFRMKGYSKQPEAMTAQVVSEDGWIKTGDIGRVDSRNRWYMKGRSKDMLKIDGVAVSTADIELCILAHPEISDVVVVPILLSGEDEPVPKGFIVNQEGSCLTKSDLLEWIACSLPIWMQLIGGITFLTTLPTTNNNKIDRKALREMANVA